MSNVENGSVVIKQAGGLASDARVEFEIDRERKEIVISMFTDRGTPFASRVAIEEFFLHFLPAEHNLIVFDDETLPQRKFSDWMLYLDVELKDIGIYRFRVAITRQATFNGVNSVEIALLPQGPGAQAQDKARPLLSDGSKT